MFSQPPPFRISLTSISSSSHCSKCITGVSAPRLLPLFLPVMRIHRIGPQFAAAAWPPPRLRGWPSRCAIWLTPTGVWTTNVGMPVSWQMGPSSSCAMSMFERMMSSACADCVPGVSTPAASDMAARTSGGRLVEVWVISSKRLPARNSIRISVTSILRQRAGRGRPARSMVSIQLQAHVGHHAGADGGDGAVEFHHHLRALDLFDIAGDAGGSEVGNQDQRRLSGP